MQIKFLFVAIFAMVSSVASAQSMSATDAQSLGSSVGASLNNSTAAGVTDANAMNTVPGYTSTPPANLASSLGSNSLNALGASQNTQCDQAGFVKGGTVANQECNASVTLRKNTNYGQMSASQMPQPSTTFTASSILGSSTSTSFCQSYATPGGTAVNAQTCSESLVSYESLCNRIIEPACSVTNNGISRSFSANGSTTINLPDINTNSIQSATITLTYLMNGAGLWINGEPMFGGNIQGPGPYVRTSRSAPVVNFWSQFVDAWVEPGCGNDSDGNYYCWDGYMSSQWNPNFVLYQNGGGNNSAWWNVGTWDIKDFLTTGDNTFSSNHSNYGGASWVININQSIAACAITAWTDNCASQKALR